MIRFKWELIKTGARYKRVRLTKCPLNYIRLVDSDWLLMELLKEMLLCAQDKGN